MPTSYRWLVAAILGREDIDLFHHYRKFWWTALSYIVETWCLYRHIHMPACTHMHTHTCRWTHKNTYITEGTQNGSKSMRCIVTLHNIFSAVDRITVSLKRNYGSSGEWWALSPEMEVKGGADSRNYTVLLFFLMTFSLLKLSSSFHSLKIKNYPTGKHLAAWGDYW